MQTPERDTPSAGGERSGVESKWTVPGRYQRSKKRVNQLAIAELLSAVDMFDLVRESGVHLLQDKKTGDGSFADCPFHTGGEDRRTLLIDPSGFSCCVCGFRGSALGWLIYHEGLGFFESLEHLALKSGITNEARPSLEDLEMDRAFKHEHLRRACAAYQRALTMHKGAQDYLTGRGINAKSMERFRIGFSSTTGQELLDGNKPNQRALWQVGIQIRQKDGQYRPRFRGRIMFPIRDVDGNVLGFGARDISGTDNSRKYINSPGSPLFNKSKILYGLYEATPAIQEHDRMFIVEGYTDVIAASQAGVHNFVATLGTSVTEQHVKIALACASHLTFCLDADAAGQARVLPALIHALKFVSDLHTVDVLSLPAPMDPDEYFAEHSADQFMAMAAKSMPIEEALFMDFGKLNQRDIGEMARFGVHAADLIVSTASTAIATTIRHHAESLLGISLDAEIERAMGRVDSRQH